MNPLIWISVFVGVAAILEDVSRRQISNWIPCAALAGGLTVHSFQDGWSGAGSSLLGAITGFSVFLIFYVLGGMGGGDVKLMAGFGAVLGGGKVLEAALWTAACGGVLAVLYLFTAWIRALFAGKTKLGDRAKPASVVSIPYAPAIAAGVWLSLVPKV